MKNEAELISAVNDGFRKWLTVAELKDYISDACGRISSDIDELISGCIQPELFLVAFNSKQGFVKLELKVVKMVKVVDEAGRLIDLELEVINDDITEPIKLLASVFQPDSHPRVQFCRIFTRACDRDSYYEDIRFLSDLNNDYTISYIELMRRQLKF